MSTCKNCLKILVCKYNDGHNLFCKENYKCPHFLDISILEKQIPKKVELYTNDGNFKWENYPCPCCKEMLGLNVNKRHVKFCPNCGQALDWSE